MMLVMKEMMAMATAVAVATNACGSIIVLFFKNYELHECDANYFRIIHLLVQFA